jgi:hypothetical protein
MSEMMQEGEYFVGDLCYVLSDEQWDEVCRLTFPFRRGPNKRKSVNGKFVLKGGVEISLHGTAYGDGVYLDQRGREYGVDSGTIGCVSVKHLGRKTKAKIKKQPWLGHIHEMHYSFASKDESGKLRFGPVVIDTTGEDE